MPTLRLSVALLERQPITTEHFILDEMQAAAKTILLWHDNLRVSIDYVGEEQ